MVFFFNITYQRGMTIKKTKGPLLRLWSVH